jgi:hypothetical protein
MEIDSNEFLDLCQLQRVLDEIEESCIVPREVPQTILSDWGDLTEVLDDIKDNLALKDKLKEILKWINNNHTHTYPMRLKGWINTIRSQFCPTCGEISAIVVVDHLVRLGILNVVEYNKRVRRQIISTSKVRLNRKRCRSEVVDEELSFKHRKS